MQETPFIWMDGKLTPWKEANVHVLTHALHYGSGAFEGVRAYDTAKGPAVFRLKEHLIRLQYSSQAIKLEIPFSVDALAAATVELIKANKLSSCYIRPLVFYGYGKMGLNPKGAPTKVAIACWPWGQYLPHEAVDIKVSSFIRIHPKSAIADAKICGHYVNSILAVQEIAGTHYHEALFLDYEGHIAEGPGENFFIISGDTLITPQRGTILNGITRETVMTLARSQGFTVREQCLSLDEALNAEEAFFTGTAAEVVPIRSIDDQKIGNGGVGPKTAALKKLYLDVVHGRVAEYERFLTYVNG